jgi:hypothetical protein
MFKPLLHFAITLTIIMIAAPVFAASSTYQLSVTVPAHTTPVISLAQQVLINNIPQVTRQQVIQQEQITRNDQTVTVQSIVVL